MGKPGTIHYKCEHCGIALEAAWGLAGKRDTCVDCHQPVDVPLLRAGGWLLLPAFAMALAPVRFLIDILAGVCTWSDVVMMLVWLLVAITFFRAWKSAPIAMIWLLVFNVVWTVFVGIISEASSQDFAPVFIGKSLAAVIWIPYFLKSKRVKATFVR